MKYLVIDTCADKLIISIIQNMEMIYYYGEKTDTTLSKKANSILAKAFEEAKLNIRDIDKIFIVNGPGSFTGIRVGVTIAKTIGYCLNIPVIPISELELLATTEVKGNRMPIIDARRGYVFGAVYDENLNIIVKEQHILFEDLKKTVDDYTVIDKDNEKINLLTIIRKHEMDKPIDVHLLNPNYLKKTEAEEKLHDS